MNPFDYIKEMKDTIKAEAKNAGINSNYLGKNISQAEHYEKMLNMLNVLEIEMQQAEYNYQIKTVEQKIKTFDEHVVIQKRLNEDVLIFQPVGSEDEIRAVDMQSLADVLRRLHDTDVVKETMLLLPPSVNVFRAVLANGPNGTDDEDWDEDYISTPEGLDDELPW